VPYAPTVTQYLTEDPMPRVEVAFTSLDPATARIEAIYRQSEGREYKVRGGIDFAVSGATARLDFEVPFGADVTYRAQMLNSLGESLGYTDASTPVSVPVPDMWVHNPLDPSTGVKVAFRDSAARELSRPVNADVYFPQMRRVAVVLGGERQGLRGVNLDVVVDTIEDADKFSALVGGYSTRTVPVLCFRMGAFDRVRLPRPLFAAVTDPREIDLTYALGGETIAYSLTGDEAAPPTPALVVPLLTRADVNAYYATRAALNSGNLTRFDLNRRYGIAGYSNA